MKKALLAVFLLLSASHVFATPDYAVKYGVDSFVNYKRIEVHTARFCDSLVAHTMQGKPVYNAISFQHSFRDMTIDFYLMVTVILVLGLIRLSDPKYFYMLLRSFFNFSSSNRQLKEQVQSAKMSNLLMNIFFGLSAGAYLFYVVKSFLPGTLDAVISPVGWLFLLIGGISIIYTVKYFAITLSGWAFRVSSLTEQYIYNVFLVNKVVGVALLPFTIMLAFGGTGWVYPAFVVSLIVVGLLFLNRYIRSWQAFGSFFQFSKFHFFIYLCASELLPIAVLTKFIMNGML